MSTKPNGHTPGPWEVCEEDGRPGVPTSIFAPGTEQILFRSSDRKSAEALADARLIAAAPEMLEALRGLLEAWEVGSISRMTEAELFARTIIAKATGGGR